MISTRFAVILATSLALAAPAFAGPAGTYKRPNGETAHVTVNDGKLYCKIVYGQAEGFEMCNGLDQSGEAWQGKGMKHPEMPDFMTFTGSVMASEAGLQIKGCAVGQSMCDTEKWIRVD